MSSSSSLLSMLIRQRQQFLRAHQRCKGVFSFVRASTLMNFVCRCVQFAVMKWAKKNGRKWIEKWKKKNEITRCKREAESKVKSAIAQIRNEWCCEHFKQTVIYSKPLAHDSLNCTFYICLSRTDGAQEMSRRRRRCVHANQDCTQAQMHWPRSRSRTYWRLCNRSKSFVGFIYFFSFWHAIHAIEMAIENASTWKTDSVGLFCSAEGCKR